MLTTALALPLFLVAMLAVAWGTPRSRDLGGTAVRWGLLATSIAVVAGFILNRNIYNSDNYRYLVLLLVPWRSGSAS